MGSAPCDPHVTANRTRERQGGVYTGAIGPGVIRWEDGPLVERLIEQFTYVGLFVALFAAGLGVPVPEEVPVMAGGALAHQQVVRWWIALPVCFLGVLSGDVLLYWVGHHWGERILGWRVVRLVLSPEREAALLAGYRRHGLKIVFTARHVLGLRAAAFLTAGIARVPFTRFLAVDALAALVSVPVSFGLAYFFTDRVEALLRDIRRVEGWVVLAGLVAIGVALAVVSYRRSRRLAARGGPGPAGDGVL